MNSMESYLNFNFLPILNLALLGVLLYVILYLGDRITNAYAGKNGRIKNLASNWPLLERSLWAVYLLILLGVFIKSNPITGTVVAGVLLISLWSFWRNFVLGIMLQYSGRFVSGQSVRIDGEEGTITAMKTFVCELTLVSSTHDIVQIPYKHLEEARITQTSPSENSVSGSVDFSIAKPQNIVLAKVLIQKELHNNSWLLIEDQHTIELQQEDEKFLHFKAIIHGLDNHHLQKAKDQLKNFQFEES